MTELDYILSFLIISLLYAEQLNVFTNTIQIFLLNIVFA